MVSIDPVVWVLGFASVATGTSALAAGPHAFGRDVRTGFLGAANAAAAGLMLGVGYLLMELALHRSKLLAVVGALLGVAYTRWTHHAAGDPALDTLPAERASSTQGVQLVLRHAVHAMSEGVAIGFAMAIDLALGGLVAVALAGHNVAEALSLAQALRVRGLGPRQVAGLCVITRVPQVVLAVFAYALAPLGPAFLDLGLGFAAGTLVLLTLTELLPAAYRASPRGVIAVLVSAHAGAVVLLRALALG